ncbi:MAG: LytTR family transcriptional regulator DNA-binding domain-containing protein [Bacteroidetes bacterium]|nr:LytTR family transcriptional regulator DNA-binding domain-containing protein [Bacteroidota bacterium]
MMKVLIIDDEPLARNVIKEYLKPYKDLEVVGECNDGFEGIKAIQEFQPDLIFLDIQMPRINGFEMLELVENKPRVIFTTAYEEYAIKAFDLHAIDYLLKPFDKNRFDKAIEKTRQQQSSAEKETFLQSIHLPAQMHRIVVKDGNKIRIIPLSQIFYIEAADDYVKIFTQSESFLKKQTMAYFEENLQQNQFARVHRSYLVNTQTVTRIDPYEKDGHLVLLTNGKKIPVSKSGYKKLKEMLGL